MAAVDLSSLAEIVPLLTFLVVFILAFAVLNKTKVIENSFIQLLVAGLLALMFITAAGARAYVENIVPWFAVLLVCLFFVMAVLGFVGQDVDFMRKGLGAAFIGVLIVALLVSGAFIFSDSLRMYYDGFVSSSRTYGAVVLVFAAVVVGWVLLRVAAKK